MTQMKKNKLPQKKIKQSNKNPLDPRKQPAPGYPEKNPRSKKDVQDHPEEQHTG